MNEVCSEPECERPVLAKGMCSLHYQRVRAVKRKAEQPPKRLKRPSNLSDHDSLQWGLEHYAHRDPSTGCLIWDAARDVRGYALLGWGKKLRRVHRWVLADATGKGYDELLPEDYALHSCNRGHEGCVEVTHLRWGTAKENTADCIAAGNHASVTRWSTKKES